MTELTTRTQTADGSPTDLQPLLLDVRQVAHLLGIGVRTVWRLSSSGELPAPISLGRAKRWERQAIERYVRMKVTR